MQICNETYIIFTSNKLLKYVSQIYSQIKLPVKSSIVTRSDKIGLIAEKYTCSVYGVYQLICGCYLNIVCFF